jgi:hypothetical protein
VGFFLRDFNQILEDIRQARTWYESIGIGTDGTRVALIEERVGALLVDLKWRPAKEVVERWHRAATYYALGDGMGFGRIAREIAKVGPSLLPKKNLRTLLEGPLEPQDEVLGDASVNARNIFTELELAAYFSERGIAPKGFDDLRFCVGTVEYSVQCKRLLSPSRVNENVEKAYQQLKKNFLKDDDLGLIALATDKMMGLEGKILRVENEAVVTAEAFRLAEEFTATYASAWSAIADSRVIAILLIARFLCLSVEHNVVAPAYYINILPTVSKDVDRIRLREIVSLLKGVRIVR